jgi:hypothetical protein
MVVNRCAVVLTAALDLAGAASSARCLRAVLLAMPVAAAMLLEVTGVPAATTAL